MAAMAFFPSCSNDADELALEAGINTDATTTSADASLFPVDNGEETLPAKSRTKSLMYLINKMDKNRALSLETVEISSQELAEIKAFVDEELAGNTQKETYDNIFAWITQNIKYAWAPTPAYLNPYDVFKYKTCICQGYANLLKTMCITQGIPAMGVNGELVGVGAHAWNYVCADNVWYVSDPTNGLEFAMENESDYAERLAPARSDIALFEDDTFLYSFEEGCLNISGVKAGAPETITLPYGVGGYKITTFNPLTPLPINVKTIYIGKNIEDFGPYVSAMKDNTPGVEAVYVDPSSRHLKEHEGVVYTNLGNTPYYIPTCIKKLVLKKAAALKKNIVYGYEQLETIIVADGTRRIDAYAFEKCENLKKVVVPNSTTMDDNAIYNCGSNWEVIRMESTGIHNVTM